MRRRSILGLVAGTISGGAGCLDAFGDDDESVRDRPDESDTWTIEPETFRTYRFALNEDGRIEYDGAVTDGPPVDYLLLPEGEFAPFDDNSRFAIITRASHQDTRTASVDTSLAPGLYTFVVDNSKRGDANPPDGDATATVELTLSVTADTT